MFDLGTSFLASVARDPDALAESVRRAVRSAVNEEWGKKPLCFVHVLEV